MIEVSTIFILTYSLLMGIFIGIGYFFQLQKEKSYQSKRQKTTKTSIDLSELIVIIPFRNEEQRLGGLLESINNSAEKPKEFIFVDDHSQDNSVELISAGLKNVKHRILRLPTNQEGKKRAIRFAIAESKSESILSMDADVEFSSNYFSELKKLSTADMYILPAILQAKKWYEHVYEVDLILVNAANCGISGLKRPIMASGANLFYKRSSFEHFDRYESHSHMPSGDDIYLLRDFRKADTDIRLITESSLAIHTETPQSIREFFNQRLRWIAKTGDVKDHLSTALAIVQVLLTFSFVGLLIAFAINGEWKSLFVLYLLKICIDLLVFLPYFNRIKRLRSWLFIPFYEIIFPLYSLLILGMMYFYKPVWKGRKLDVNF